MCFTQRKRKDADMRRMRKTNIKKEKIIMIASSAFVLAALTLTGVYMSGRETESKDDGYTLDFTALEDNAGDKPEEIADNEGQSVGTGDGLLGGIEEQEPGNLVADGQVGMPDEVVDGELDYMPLEVGSGQIEIPGLTDQQVKSTGDTLLPKPGGNESGTGRTGSPDRNTNGNTAGEDAAGAEESAAQTAGENVAVEEQSLNFTTENGLLRPVSGEILMHYSMSSSIYFATLDQYKYNPAVIISADQGTPVSCGAEGKVIGIYDDAVLGKVVELELGGGYMATYGQLTDVAVSVGSYVDEGDILGYVAAPTKYYSLEGTNLYFALTKDGTPVNPEVLFR